MNLDDLLMQLNHEVLSFLRLPGVELAPERHDDFRELDVRALDATLHLSTQNPAALHAALVVPARSAVSMGSTVTRDPGL